MRRLCLQSINDYAGIWLLYCHGVSLLWFACYPHSLYYYVMVFLTCFAFRHQGTPNFKRACHGFLGYITYAEPCGILPRSAYLGQYVDSELTAERSPGMVVLVWLVWSSVAAADFGCTFLVQALLRLLERQFLLHKSLSELVRTPAVKTESARVFSRRHNDLQEIQPPASELRHGCLRFLEASGQRCAMTPWDTWGSCCLNWKSNEVIWSHMKSYEVMLAYIILALPWFNFAKEGCSDSTVQAGYAGPFSKSTPCGQPWYQAMTRWRWKRECSPDKRRAESHPQAGPMPHVGRLHSHSFHIDRARFLHCDQFCERGWRLNVDWLQ